MGIKEKLLYPDGNRHRAWVEFGGPGHESEYIFATDNADDGSFLYDVDVALSESLGNDWCVSNRGTRLEIVNKKKFGARDDEKIRKTLETIIKPLGYSLIK